MPEFEQHKRPSGRPSLLGGKSYSDASITEDSVRILGTSTLQESGIIDAGATANRSLRPIAWVLAVLAISVALAILIVPNLAARLFGEREARSAGAPREKLPAQEQAAATVATRENTVPTKPVSTISLGLRDRSGVLGPVQAGDSGAATITDEPKPAKPYADVGAVKPDQLVSALEAGSKPHSTSLKIALEAVAPVTKAKPATTAPLVNRVHIARHEEPTVPKATPSTTKASSGDSDVSLLAALVAHDLAKDTKTPRSKAGESVRPAKTVTASSTAPSTGKSKTAAGADTAESRPVAGNTESELQRCQTQDFVDAEMCRWRICSGKWDTDAACKVQ